MLYMIVKEDCPYCSEAKKNLEKLLEFSPELQKIPITISPEGKQTHREWDYYYVPAFFWDKRKLSEGVFTVTEIQKILNQAYDFHLFGEANRKKGESHDEKKD